jgi:hypothetical protein
MLPRCVPKSANGNPAAARPPIDWERIASVRRRPALPTQVAMRFCRSSAVLSAPRCVLLPVGFRGNRIESQSFSLWSVNFFVSSCSLD